MRPYNEAVKADVRRRMGTPHRQSVAEISQGLGIHVITLYKSRKSWRLQGEVRYLGVGWAAHWTPPTRLRL